MTGFSQPHWPWSRLCAVLACGAVLAGCEDGAPAVFGGDQPVVAGQATSSAQDVERPDLFNVTDRGLWDGRPSLGGLWVAHPDVREPERVLIRNNATGQSTTGALFRRERENPGPLLQLSSDAADALGILPGAPTELTVVALRRVEAESEPVAEPVTEPVADTSDADADAIAPLPVPVEIAATALAPAAAADADDLVVVNLPPATQPGLPMAPLAQVGVFGQKANADAAAAKLQAGGFTAAVLPLQTGNSESWQVVAGPVPDAAALAGLRALGFADAYIIAAPS